MEDDTIAGLLLTIIPSILLIWYLIVMRAIWKCIAKSGSFILIFSQSIADVCILLQFIMLGLELFAGYPFIPVDYEQWYSVILIGCWMPMTAHYILIAVNRCSATIHKQYEKFWSKRKCLCAALIGWLLGNVYNCGIRLVGIPESAYAVHMAGSYGFRPRNVTNLVTSVLPTTYLAIYFTAAFVCASCYFAAVVYISATIRSQASLALRLEARLTIICILNTVPFLCLVIVSATQKINTKWKQLMYSFRMIFNCSIQSILLPSYSSLIKEHLFPRD